MSPKERLKAVLASIQTTKVKFSVEILSHHKQLLLKPTVTSQYFVQDIGDELQSACKKHFLLNEIIDDKSSTYRPYFNESSLFCRIVEIIGFEYELRSKRCKATKRKTINFINDISLDSEKLASFILQMFVNINSDSYAKKTITEKEEFFEPLESLRRVYGKRP